MKSRKWTFGCAVALVALLLGCDTSTNTQDASQQQKRETNENALSGFKQEDICRATISFLMSQPVNSIEATSVGDKVQLQYIRSSDQSVWQQKCYVRGSEVVWGAKDGRWRNSEFDPKISAEITGNGSLRVIEVYSDGSSRSETFSPEAL